VGFVSSVVSAERSLQKVSRAIPRTDLALYDGNDLLAATGSDVHGPRFDRAVSGRSLGIVASEPQSLSIWPAVRGGVVAAAIVLLVGFALLRRRAILRRRRAAMERQVGVAALAGRLAGVSTAREIQDAVAQLVPPALAAGGAQLRLREAGAAVHPGQESMRDGYIARELLLDAARTEPMVVHNVAQSEALSVRARQALAEAGVVTFVSTPLVTSTGASLGELIVGWSREFDIGVETSAAIEIVARLCVETIERVLAAAREHEVLQNLQARAIRAAESVEPHDIAVVYESADELLQMGGDWYDVFAHDGRVNVVVGDVAGHGHEAIAEMIEARAVIRALLEQGADLRDALNRIDRSFAKDGRLGSLLVVRLDDATQQMEHLSAGHPPAIVRLTSGDVRLVEEPHRPMVGTGVDSDVESGRTPFPPGSVLLAYTDGLVERRSRSIDDGIQHLIELMADMPTSAALLAEQVHSTADRPFGDDVAIVVAIAGARSVSGTGARPDTESAARLDEQGRITGALDGDAAVVEVGDA
jgi:hypothetical protein